MPAKPIKFVSREQQLELRGMRNLVRWMAKVHNRSTPAQEHQWRDEAFLERKADAEWKKRHGSGDRPASVAEFPR